MPKQITRVKWSAMDIPFGVEFDETTGTFSGAPEDEGEYIVPVSVQTNYGKDTKDVVLSVEEGKNKWREIAVSNISPIYSFDTEQGVMILGSSSKTYYNPADKTFSNKSSIDVNTYAADIDPITKKWVCLGDNISKGIASPTGTHALSSMVGSIGSAHCCWSPALSQFCFVKTSFISGNPTRTGYHYSILCDIDGNPTEQARVDNIGDFAGYYLIDYDLSVTRQTQYSGDRICWASGNINKFVLATYQTTPTVALSADGLNWESVVIPTTVNGWLTCMFWLPEHNMLLCAQYDRGTGNTHIYISNDGITWTKTTTLIGSYTQYPSVDTYAWLFTGDWSPTKKVFCLCGSSASFITRDFENWDRIALPTSSINYNWTHVRWSNIANAFLLNVLIKGLYTLKV